MHTYDAISQHNPSSSLTMTVPV